MKHKFRMTAGRKASILSNLALGYMTDDDAMQVYNLSHEELNGWKHNFARRGVNGLKVTKCKKEPACLRLPNRELALSPLPLKVGKT